MLPFQKILQPYGIEFHQRTAMRRKRIWLRQNNLFNEA